MPPFDFLERGNQVHGNFVPAKSSIINTSEVAQRLRTRLNLKSNIASLQKKRADFEDRLRALPDNQELAGFRRDIQDKLDESLVQLSQQERGATGEAELRTYGSNTFIHIDEDYRK